MGIQRLLLLITRGKETARLLQTAAERHSINFQTIRKTLIFHSVTLPPGGNPTEKLLACSVIYLAVRHERVQRDLKVD